MRYIEKIRKTIQHKNFMKEIDNDLFVVGIGASAGGLDAIQQLFDNLPINTGMAFVIIQHLSPDFKSLMPELLGKHTQMKIFTAEDQQTIEPNCIYLNQRSKNLHIKGRQLVLQDKGPKHNLNLPIDIFFHTLGEEHKDKSIGVILSGTGSDGSRGIRTIKEAGGSIIVQSPDSAQFDGMPNSAISTNLVDFIQGPEEIAKTLSRFINKRLSIDSQNLEDQSANSNEILFLKILEEIHKSFGIDFKKYKKNTLLRRLEKRLNINNIEHLYDYFTLLKSNPKERNSLMQDFLIGVTAFFRDLEAFNLLRNSIIPQICKSKTDTESVRIWVPGCSTGEEVYSIAMLFDEYIRLHKLNFDFKIFATDIDTRALDVASNGIYNVNIANEIYKHFLETYFIKSGEKVQINKRLREKIVFSGHNLLKDPPFIRMDFISCRNMLIYLENKSQQKVLADFQFALNKFGFLFLGNSESLGDVGKSFKVIDSKWKIYQNISESKQFYIRNTEDSINTISYKTPIHSVTRHEYRYKDNPDTIFYKYLSNKFSPSCIFINDEFNILFIKGDAGKRLIHSEGAFQNNLLKVVSPEISVIIKNGIRSLKVENRNTIVKDILNGPSDDRRTIDISFYRPDNLEELKDTYVVQFSEDQNVEKEKLLELKNIPVDEVSKRKIEDLEDELKEVKARLQNVIEELETSNEELQSSNEELMASNEELQSTNEELQSVNEELYTVNSELQEKNKELQSLNNDISNLLNSTEIGTLFLDLNFHIRKFTPALQKHFRLEENDIGRPISSFASSFKEDIREMIIENSKQTLNQLTSYESEITDSEGNYYLVRISPFITSDKKIDGVVITFIDISQLRAIEANLETTEIRYKQLFEHLNEGFLHAQIIKDQEGRPVNFEYININPAFEKQIGLKREEVIGKKGLDVIPGLKGDNVKWIDLYGHTALTGEEQSIEIYSELRKKYYLLHIFSPNKNEFASTFTDVTKLKESEKNLQISEGELKKVQEITHTGSWYMDVKTGEVKWNEELYRMYGFDPKFPPPSYSEHKKLFVKESWDKLYKALENTRKTQIPYQLELKTIRKDGTNGWMWVRGETITDQEGKVIAMWGAAQDISDRKIIENELLEAKKKADVANIHKNYFLANMSHEIRTPMNGVIGFSRLLKEEDISKEERNKFLDIIDDNANQLLSLIDDIIDVASIESNQLKISLDQCNVPVLLTHLEEIFNNLKTEKEKGNIHFELYIPSGYETLVINTDCIRLRQVISNLLNNSLKFSEKGTIRFGFEIKKSKIEFFVKDEGIGIAKEAINDIFKRFKQLNYGKEAEYGGTGLGLAICKGIVKLLGGKISVSSELGKGSEFRFDIPLKEFNAEVTEPSTNGSNIDYTQILKNKKLLIAEDEAMIQVYFNEIFKNYDIELLFANNGKEAVKLYHKNIDVVLMDLRMPEMNGFEAIDKILKINPKAKIFAQTAYVMDEEKEKCMEAGCIAYLTKPITKEILLKELKQHLQ